MLVVAEGISENSDILVEPYAAVRIPSLAMTKSKEPSSMCILRASTCSTITNTPGFYTPIPSLDPTKVVFTKEIPDMGVGLFAKCAVKAQHVVFSERPLLIFPKILSCNRQGLSDEEAIEKHQLTFEKQLEQVLHAMTKEDSDAYKSLSNCLPKCPRLYGIARTNAFGTGSDIEEDNFEEGKVEHAAVGRLASRINHSYVAWSLFQFSTCS